MGDQEKDICNFRQFKRNKYFYGKLLTVGDFEDEQSYFRGKGALINRIIHGGGIVCGLSHSISNDGKITITPGVAFDCCGREIVVSKDITKDLKDDLKDKNDGIHYIYLEYDECFAEKVPCVVKSATVCDEKCDYSKIVERARIIVDTDPPYDGEISGKITDSKGPIESALIQALQNDIVKGCALSDPGGNYEIFLPSGLPSKKYTIHANATGYKSAESHDVDIDANASLTLEKAGPSDDNDPLAVEMNVAFYEDYLKECFSCADPKKARVFIAAVNKSTGAGNSVIIGPNPDETEKYRVIVPSNTMLYKLLKVHIFDYNNPHRTSAEQTEALQSINNVGNTSNAQSYVSNIDLVSKEGTINIDADPDLDNQKINLDIPNSILKKGNGIEINVDQQFPKTFEISTTAIQTINGVPPSSSNGAINLVEGKNITINENTNNSLTISSADILGFEEDLTTLEIDNWNHEKKMLLSDFMKIIRDGLCVKFYGNLPVSFITTPEEIFLVAAKIPVDHDLFRNYQYEYFAGEVGLEGVVGDSQTAKFILQKDTRGNTASIEEFLKKSLDLEKKHGGNSLTILIQIKCDFIIDKQGQGKAVDGHYTEHYRKNNRSGLIYNSDGSYVGGVRGGLFESWLKITSPNEPHLELDLKGRSNSAIGELVTATVSNFDNNENVKLTFSNADGLNPVELITKKATNGGFTADFKIPDNAVPGLANVKAVGQTSRKEAGATSTVVKAYINLSQYEGNPEDTVTISGGNYIANEDNIKINFANAVIASTKADNQGRLISVNFDIPGNATSGPKKVTAVGSTRSAEATFTVEQVGIATLSFKPPKVIRGETINMIGDNFNDTNIGIEITDPSGNKIPASIRVNMPNHFEFPYPTTDAQIGGYHVRATGIRSKKEATGDFEVVKSNVTFTPSIVDRGKEIVITGENFIAGEDIPIKITKDIPIKATDGSPLPNFIKVEPDGTFELKAKILDDAKEGKYPITIGKDLPAKFLRIGMRTSLSEVIRSKSDGIDIKEIAVGLETEEGLIKKELNSMKNDGIISLDQGKYKPRLSNEIIAMLESGGVTPSGLSASLSDKLKVDKKEIEKEIIALVNEGKITTSLGKIYLKRTPNILIR